MTDKMTFGHDPEGVDRLFAVGLQGQGLDSDQDVTLRDSRGPFMEKPGAWIGPYKLLDVLGEGGMGIVYLAEQKQPIRRRAALKVIKPGMDSKRVIARFEAERQALAMMDHPHIAHVFDAGLTPSGRPHFVMEYVKGSPLTDHCDQQRLTIEARLALFLHVCEAVQHAHQKGIIHRDLKPSNILIAVHDGEAVPKVIDFGIARAVSQPLTERTLYTEQGQLMGTPEYMSPEQADAGRQDIDTRTDIYSLGVLLYVLLTGVLPFDRKTFDGKGIDAMRKVICEQDPATPSTKLHQTCAADLLEFAQRRQTDARTLQYRLKGDLDWITLKAMDKDRTRRYATVDTLAADIRHYLNDQPVSAAPPAVFYRVKKSLRRNRRTVAGIGVGLVLLLGLFWAVRTTIQAGRDQARVEALEHEQRLIQAQDAYGDGQSAEALARVMPLLTSPAVGRRARLLHAQLALEGQGPSDAVAELEQLLSVPDRVAGQAHFLLANIYYNGDPCTPGGTGEYYQRWQTHREQAEQLIASTASYYFLRARAATGVRDMLTMLGKALELDRQHYDSLRERAQIYQSQYSYDKMMRDAARMIGIRPDHPQGYGLGALALQGMGRFEEALVDHNEAINLAPEDPQFYDARRETYSRLGQHEPALRDAQTCAQLRPRDLSYRHKLFAAYTRLGRYEEAQREHNRFLDYPFLREHRLGDAPIYLRGIFYLFSFKLVTESVAANRSWHGPQQPPANAHYAYMFEMEAAYRELSARAQRLVPKGFHPTWSPDGTRLAYSHGLLAASGVAVRDMDTGQITLLTTAGRNPEWSPDGLTIAFERTRRIWSPASLAGLSIRTWQPHGWRPRHTEEIWTLDMRTHAVRRVGEGTCPRWGHRSGRLYYTVPNSKTLVAVSLSDSNPTPQKVLPDCRASAVISPDERYVADHDSHEIRIVDVASQEVVSMLLAPPTPLGKWTISWSPDSRELCIGNWTSSLMGLWIYDRQTGALSKVLDRTWMTSRWAPDRSTMALTLGTLMEIWQVALQPGRPTIASFSPVQTLAEHDRQSMEQLNRWIAMDPAFVHVQYQRAYCGLWMGHPQATDYLQQFAQALPPYHAGDCAREAKEILDATPALRKRLLPLALLLARKAVEKEPDNSEFLQTLDEALRNTHTDSPPSNPRP